MRELGGPYRRLQALFNNSAALRLGDLSDSQRKYLTFTFVAEPIHHMVDGFAFVQSGLSGSFNLSDSRWGSFMRDLAAAPRRSSDFMRTRLFYNPHLLPQALFLNQHDADTGKRLRLDFIGKLGSAFGSDWASLVRVLRGHIAANGDSPPEPLASEALTERYAARRSTPSRARSLQQAEAALLKDAEVLAAVCRIRWQEFACLDWPLPAACAKEYDRLAKVAWHF